MVTSYTKQLLPADNLRAIFETSAGFFRVEKVLFIGLTQHAAGYTTNEAYLNQFRTASVTPGFKIIIHKDDLHGYFKNLGDDVFNRACQFGWMR